MSTDRFTVNAVVVGLIVLGLAVGTLARVAADVL
jgi:hypothetical protein